MQQYQVLINYEVAMAIPYMVLLQVATMLGENGNVRILDSVDQSDTCYIKKMKMNLKKKKMMIKKKKKNKIKNQFLCYNTNVVHPLSFKTLYSF